MRALTNSTPLGEVLHVKSEYSPRMIRTIGEAADFIVKLPKQYDGKLHWTMAGAALDAATDKTNSERISHATRAMKNALLTDNMLAIAPSSGS